MQNERALCISFLVQPYWPEKVCLLTRTVSSHDNSYYVRIIYRIITRKYGRWCCFAPRTLVSFKLRGLGRYARMLIGDLKQKFSSSSGGIMFDFLIFDLGLFLIMRPNPCYSPDRGVYRIEYPHPQSSRDSRSRQAFSPVDDHLPVNFGVHCRSFLLDFTTPVFERFSGQPIPQLHFRWNLNGGKPRWWPRHPMRKPPAPRIYT